VLYQMASGAKPFRAITIPELFSSILRDTPAPLPTGVSTDLQLVIGRCLEREPDRRYQRADEVRAALEAIQAGTTPAWARWRARVRRHSWLAPAGSALALVTLLVGANVGGVRDRLTGSPSTADPIKLAVLPFANLTGDPEQEYFSDGLTDEMITQLGRLHPAGLSVIARTSSLRYKKRGVPIDQIGRELGVDYVLEGSARQEGGRVRISATLVRVRDQTQRWADSFDRELAGILALQSDVARLVAESLSLTLLPTEQTQLANAGTVNPGAYEAYLKGRFHAEKLTPPDLDVALEYFEAALAIDPTYAPAYTGIVSVWVGKSQMGYARPAEGMQNAKAAAAKALMLDDTLSLAHAALAGAAWTEWDWDTSEREFLRTIELDPGAPNARAAYSHLLIALNRPDEALRQAERAVQLDPLNAFNQALYGTVLYLVRRYDEAAVRLENVLKTAPDQPVAHCALWYTFNVMRRFEPALSSAEGCLGHYTADIKNILSRGFSEAGYPGAMRRLGDRLAVGVNGVYVAPIDVFLAYVHAGQKDLALEWLSKSAEARDPNISGALRDPFVSDSLRDDPRFQAVLRRARLLN
jgi:TolB-like protein